MRTIENGEINYICRKCSDRLLFTFFLPTGDSVVDGSVVTWGGPDNGGDSSAVASSLSSDVSSIVSNVKAFAALKADGSVVT